MNIHNIFLSADIHGILAHKKSGAFKTVKELIIDEYGFDPTKDIRDPDHVARLQSKANNPPRFGWVDYEQIPDYARLISSKSSSEGHKITPNDIQNGRVTNLYELQIVAQTGDVIRWWGHSIDAMNPIQCVISNITHMRHSGRNINTPKLDRGNVSFYFPANTGYGNMPSDGINVGTNTAYTVEMTVPSDWRGKIISYDIEILLLSARATTNRGLMSYPIAKLVVDPTINIKE